jgi:hypothetical protein
MILIESCGSGSGSVATHPSAGASSSSSVEIGPLVLSETGCTYAGPSQTRSAPTAIKMIDQTSLTFNLDLWRLNEGHSYAELGSYIQEEERRIVAGEPTLGHPAFATLIVQKSVASGTQTLEISTLAPGTYGFVCIAFDTRPRAIWLAGPLQAVT